MTAAMPLRIGTRGSPLALIQTRSFIERLRRACPAAVCEEHVIRTTGDAVQHRRLSEIGGKGLFAKEIHEALFSLQIDLAVHSLKDLETTLPPGIAIACTLPREDARDALVVAAPAQVDPAQPFSGLAAGAVVGTASLRRQAQLLHARPDLIITALRGNVQTRLDKLAAGICNASVLAYAGLKRLGLQQHAAAILDPSTMVPAAGQGIIAVTVREGDTSLRELLTAIEDAEARAAAAAERAMLARLDGSCRTPIGSYAQRLVSGELELTGLVARPDGTFLLKRQIRGASRDAERIGRELGASLRADSPENIFV